MKKIVKKFYPLLQKSSKRIYIIVYNIYVFLLKNNDKKILIASNTKTQLYGNLQYIYEELKKYDYKINVLLINNTNIIEKIKYNFRLLYHIATSKYILIDDFFPLMYVLKIRKGTKFIQVWHALGAFKRVGYSREDIDNKNSLTHRNYTDTIVSSEKIVGNYAEAFGIESSKVHPLGIPRTDMFFDEVKKEKAKQQILEQYPHLKEKRIILFAPTFRGKGRKSAHYPEKYIDLDKIYENLEKDDVFLLKLHPFIKNQLIIKDEYKDKIIDLTEYKDINKLLLITDLLITDYSSVIFDYSFMEKPIIFYVPDLKEYTNSRSFYYDYQEYIYGSIAKTKEELIKQIKAPKVDKKKIEVFKNKFLNKCDGNSTKRFVEELILK